MDEMDGLRHERPGYRLDYAEVYNWGTFDSSRGQVYRLEPQGRTALLIGQNGSGKSTLVDALLTLLVQPGIRNYNVAAGAKKRERDERTYIRGACGRSSSEDEAGSVTDYLRPQANHFSALLACFRCETTNEVFTIAQVLYLAGDQSVEKIYAIAPAAKTIANDLRDLDKADRIRPQLIERGFRATTKFSEYQGWITSLTHMRPKAMDMFNQTVAVKDIQSLNRFIRDHMLEARPWNDKINELLTHFTQLTQAHQALVRARRQVELLEPIEKLSKKERKVAESLQLSERLTDSSDSFFRSKIVAIVTPLLTAHEEQLSAARRKKDALQSELNGLDDTIRYYKNEIEQAGGERLRQIPQLIDLQQAHVEAKQRMVDQYQAHLRLVDDALPPHDEDSFVATRARLTSQCQQIRERIAVSEAQQIATSLQLAEVRDRLRDERAELEALRQRQGNLPQWLVDIRARMTESLGIPLRELPFACELMAVKPEYRDWEASLEMVLRRFALSLLVPLRHYRMLSGYVEKTSLVDERGRGQKLVYLKVSDSQNNVSSGDRLHEHSLLRRLDFREGQPLVPWLKLEIEHRYNYQCCETIAEFHSATRLAVTRQRHIKVGDHRHEKDDRPQAVDPRHFCLGWDNREKKARVAASIAQHEQRELSLSQTLENTKIQTNRLHQQVFAAEQALQVDSFEAIHVQKHWALIESLEQERNALENANEAVQLLRTRWRETQDQRRALQIERDAVVGLESQLQREIQFGRDQLKQAESVLKLRRRDGSLETHLAAFEEIEAQIAAMLVASGETLGIENLPRIESEFVRKLQLEIRKWSDQCEPLRAELVRLMQRFLNDFPEERADLTADLKYVQSFLGLLEQIRAEDLPRHEQRFKDRLNDKVLQEIGMFNATLQSEKLEITSKIQTLNASLAQLEYRPGTYMRLEPRPVHDREIRDFQLSLRECLSDALDGSAEANEARFGRIDKLIQRLRDEERWRSKVTDVRNWFDFAARELDAVTGQEHYCYEDSSGQSGGEKAKLAFTILVAAIAYQFDIDPQEQRPDRFHFVVVDEMFSKVDDRYAEYALQLFQKFGLQLLIVAPLDAKARVTEPYVGCYLQTVRDDTTRTSQVYSMTAREYEETMVAVHKPVVSLVAQQSAAPIEPVRSRKTAPIPSPHRMDAPHPRIRKPK